LHRNSSKGLKDFVFLSTALWRTQLLWLEHSQNSIEFFWLCEKNVWSSLRIAAAWIWYGWYNRLKIFLATWIESVMIMIFEILLWFVAWLIPHLIANCLASMLMILTIWWRVFMTGLLWMCVRYKHYDIVFNTSVCNNKHMWRNTQRFKSQVVQ